MTEPTQLPARAPRVHREVTSFVRRSTRMRPVHQRAWERLRHAYVVEVPQHATSSDADAVRADGKNLVVRDATPGTYTTTLADGRRGDPVRVVTTGTSRTVEGVVDGAGIVRVAFAQCPLQPGVDPCRHCRASSSSRPPLLR